jgi:hypothetical protein
MLGYEMIDKCWNVFRSLTQCRQPYANHVKSPEKILAEAPFGN